MVDPEVTGTDEVQALQQRHGIFLESGQRQRARQVDDQRCRLPDDIGLSGQPPQLVAFTPDERLTNDELIRDVPLYRDLAARQLLV